MARSHSSHRNQILSKAAMAVASLVLAASAAPTFATTTLIESWETGADGWTTSSENSTYTLLPNSTSGVTDGAFSLGVTGTAAPSYGQMLDGPSTMANTTTLATAATLSIDVLAGSSFGFQQWDLVFNNTDLGYTSVDSFSFSKSPSLNNESRLTWTIPSSITSVLATSTNPTSIIFQIGGGAGGTMYLDNLSITTTPPPVFGDETSSWIKNGSDVWENGANWSSSPDVGSIPGGAGSIITFDNNGGAITANPTVTLSNAMSAAQLTFGNTSGIGTAVNYTIAKGGPAAGITMTGSTSEIDADSGTHVINVPVSTASGNFFFGLAPNASLSIPSFLDSSFGTLTVTSPLSGGPGGGTVTLGTSLHCNLVNLSGVTTFLPGSGGFLFGITVSTGATVNLGANTWNSNSLSGDAGNGGVINVPVGGTLFTAEYGNGAPTTVFYGATLSGGGSIVVGEGQTSTDTTQQIFSNSLALFGNNSAFSGTMTAGSSFPPGTTHMTAPAVFTLEVQAANSLGDGSATNKIILDGGIFQSIGSFVATQNVVVTANGGTIDTDGPAGGVVGNGPIPGGTAITLGAISSTAAGAQLTKINSGQLTVTSIRGVGLTIGNVQSGTPTSGGTLIIGANNGTLAGAQAGVSVLTSLTIQTDTLGNYLSTLDLKNNSMIVQGAGSAGAATIAAEIAVGRNNNPTGGLWTGTGLTSSSAAAAPTNTALGMELNDNGSGVPLMTTFEGQTVADGDVLVKYTYTGDADLSGKINAADYTLIDNGFNSQSTAHPLTGWRNGDFNYDGQINGDDYTLIDNAFNTQGSVTFLSTSTPAELIASNTEQVSAVPEPGTLGLIALSGLLMSRRRSRR
jgi:Dockerin type I domain